MEIITQNTSCDKNVKFGWRYRSLAGSDSHHPRYHEYGEELRSLELQLQGRVDRETENNLRATMKLVIRSVAAALVLVISPVTQGSDGGGFNQGGFSQRKIDQQYELGKAHYKSGKVDGARLQYCLKTADGLKKLSRKSVRPFKRGPASDFVASLYSCDNADLRISEVIDEEQGQAVLYYLNKRFKLRLR